MLGFGFVCEEVRNEPQNIEHRMKNVEGDNPRIKLHHSIFVLLLGFGYCVEVEDLR